MNTVRLLNTNCDSLTYGGVSYTPDETGAFNVPADVAVAVTNKPGGFYRAPDVAPDIATPAPRTVDFLAPSANTVFDVGAIGFRKYTAEADAIVYGVAHEHCSMMLSNGCVPLPPVGWIDPRPNA